MFDLLLFCKGKVVASERGTTIQSKKAADGAYLEVCKKNGQLQLVKHKGHSGLKTKSKTSKSSSGGSSKRGTSGSSDGKKNGDHKQTTKKDAGAKQEPETHKPPNQDPSAREFTPAEDEKLKELQTQGKTWRQKAEEMNRSQKALQKRWKELQSANNTDGKQDANTTNDADNNDEGKGDKATRKRGKKGGKQNNSGLQNGNASKHDSKPKPGNGAKKNSSSNSTRLNAQEFRELHEDDVFTSDELRLIVEIMEDDRVSSWHRIASVYFDKTGKTVHPDVFRIKFGAG